MARKNLPKLVVFDLDFTLWPFWVDTHVQPPFRFNGRHVVDFQGSIVKCYPEVNEVLDTLHNMNVIMAVASRTSEIEGANQLIELFNWDRYFTYKEIYPGCKVNHFKKFKKYTNIDFEDMLFFDDENRNIIDTKKLGVTAVLVTDGMSKSNLEKGLKEYEEKNR